MLCFSVLSHKSICSDFYLHCKKQISLCLFLSFSLSGDYFKLLRSTNNMQYLFIQFFLSAFVKIKNKILHGWLNNPILLLRKLRFRKFFHSPKISKSCLPLNFMFHHLWIREDKESFFFFNWESFHFHIISYLLGKMSNILILILMCFQFLTPQTT